MYFIIHLIQYNPAELFIATLKHNIRIQYYKDEKELITGIQ